ncbi:MAG: HAD family phosphatase [Bacteroidaceae bacterium]|nr:HAD family phosphatase [Bacteroidaceae bacterium]
MKKVALFDLDGVLIDTESAYTTFWKDMGEEYFPDMPEFVSQIKGSSLLDMFARYWPNQPEEQERIQQRLDRYEQQMTYTLFEGALRLVDALRERGVRTAIVTSSNKKKMEQVYRQLPALCDHFERVFTAEDAPKAKPAPDLYLAAARQMGVDPEDCAVFEDSVNGLNAARQAGTYVVGLCTSLPPTKVELLCDELVGDLDDYYRRHFEA